MIVAEGILAYLWGYSVAMGVAHSHLWFLLAAFIAALPLAAWQLRYGLGLPLRALSRPWPREETHD
jgi:hypothetical protein